MTDDDALCLRGAMPADLPYLRRIYNEGVADRIATLDEEPQTEHETFQWYIAHDERYAIVIGDRLGEVVGWASLSRYSHRCADADVAELSVYVARAARGTGVGTQLLKRIERHARKARFHKIVLFDLVHNAAGRALYDKLEYSVVGTFREHGRLDGRYVDVLAMEKLLKPLVLFICRHNTGRSQMAEAYLREFGGGDFEVASAGTVAADRPDPRVVALMAEDGIDISRAIPKLLEANLVQRADRIITMGCDVEGIHKIDEDWGLPDPKGQSPERVRDIREMVKAKVKGLIDDLTAQPGRSVCS